MKALISYKYFLILLFILSVIFSQSYAQTHVSKGPESGTLIAVGGGRISGILVFLAIVSFPGITK
jgi:hypothetical protein